MGCAVPHPFHWQDLRKHPKEEVLRHEGVKPAPNGPGYEVAFLNAVYGVNPQNKTISELSPKPGRRPTQALQILLIRYLISNYGGPMDDVEVSEKDLPGGVTFFQGPHTLHVAPIAERFATDPEGFEALGKRFGATPVTHGDKALRFFPFPLIPVTYVLWVEDEEFPASVSVLFDRSITRWFELDMIFTVVQELTQRISED